MKQDSIPHFFLCLMSFRKAVSAVCVAGLLITVSLAGCSHSLGGQVKGEAYRSYDKDFAASKSRKAAPSVAMAREEMAAGDEAAPAPEGSDQNTAPQPDDESVIIYEADCSINVKSVSDSIRVIESFSRDFGGKVESAVSADRYGSAVVTVRVPVSRFDAFLKELPKIGQVTGKNITATNVSDEYRDLSSRLESAGKVRERLQALLKKEISVAGRIAILREIDRINTKIAGVTARLEYLKGLADLSTVRISLYASSRDSVSDYIASPFPWIASLTPHSRSVFKEASFDAETPKGYFILNKDFSDKGHSLYRSPGKAAAVRLGVIQNYPEMDLAFWTAALEDDASNRLFKPAGSAAVQGNGCSFSVRSYRTSGETWYSVAVAVRGDDILVIEDIFEGEKSFAEHYPLFETFLRTVRWK